MTLSDRTEPRTDTYKGQMASYAKQNTSAQLLFHIRLDPLKLPRELLPGDPRTSVKYSLMGALQTNKSETRMTGSILKQDPSTHKKRFRRTLFIKTKRKFWRVIISPFFQATKQHLNNIYWEENERCLPALVEPSFYVVFNVRHNRRISEIQGTALGKSLRAWTSIYRSRPAGVAQSKHAFVGGTVSTWAR